MDEVSERFFAAIFAWLHTMSASVGAPSAARIALVAALVVVVVIVVAAAVSPKARLDGFYWGPQTRPSARENYAQRDAFSPDAPGTCAAMCRHTDRTAAMREYEVLRMLGGEV